MSNTQTVDVNAVVDALNVHRELLREIKDRYIRTRYDGADDNDVQEFLEWLGSYECFAIDDQEVEAEQKQEAQDAFDCEVADRLSHVTGIKQLTGQDYREWLEGKEHHKDFDKAVRVLFGQELYDKLDRLARMDAGLLYKLGLGERVVGGIDLFKV